MRVLHVTSYFAPASCYGGPPISILGLCQSLVGAGVEVEVFTTTANGRSELPVVTEPGVTFEGVPVRYFPRGFPRRYFGVRGLEEALDVELPQKDLVHVHGLWNLPAWTAIRACRARGLPYVVSPRGMLEPAALARHRLRKRILYWTSERRHLEGASFLHATSRGEEEGLRALRLENQVVRLPNGVAPPESVAADPARLVRWGVPAGGSLIVFLGRLHPIKRIDLLLAAFARLRETQPRARLVLAGPEDGLSVLELVRDRLGVHWLGTLGGDEKWSLLASAAALVMCSDSESFGMSVLEAMAVGLPVVVARTCHWEEVETHGAGYRVEQNAEAIAQALEKLLSDPSRAREMGERGRKLARGTYGWGTIAGEMAEHYRKAAGSERP